MPFSKKEIEIRRAIQEQHDFFQHCKTCPSDTHCCTRPNNVVIIREQEKPYLEEAYEALKPSTSSNDDKLQFDDLGEGLFLLKDKNGKCPMFTEDLKCSVHATKPLDCLLWPTMFAVDKDNGPVALDVKCPATRSGKIPPRFYQIEPQIKDLVNTSQRSVYAQQNRDSYKPGRIVDVQALGHEKAQEILSKWDNIKAPIEKSIDRIWQKLEYKLSPLRYDSEDVLSVFKWILAIAIALCLEHSFKLSYQIFLSDPVVLKQITDNPLHSFMFTNLGISNAAEFIGKHNWFARLLVLMMLTLFLFDAFRVLVPLPWIFKSFRKRNLESTNHGSFRLPAFDVSKLMFISITTIYVFFFASQTFVLLNVYFFCLFVARILDSFWYISITKWLPPKEPTIIIELASRRIAQRQEDLDKKLAALVKGNMKMIANTQGTAQTSAVATATAAAHDLGSVLRHEMEELGNNIEKQANQLQNKRPQFLIKWQEYLQVKAKIEAELWVKSRWKRIAIWDFFSCLAVLSPLFLSHCFQLQTMSLCIPPSLLLFLVGAGLVSHILNITYDYWRNHDEYYDTLMILYKPRGPVSE
jgi:Fe-S-cluster containining protein